MLLHKIYILTEYSLAMRKIGPLHQYSPNSTFFGIVSLSHVDIKGGFLIWQLVQAAKYILRASTK